MLERMVVSQGFDAQDKKFVHDFAALSKLYATPAENADSVQKWEEEIGAKRHPTAVACWNALVTLGQKARTNGEKTVVAQRTEQLRTFFDAHDVSTQLLFDPFKRAREQ